MDVSDHGVLVGTAGWSYDDWAGAVYPRGLESGKRLGHYARQFPTVEVNVTYYRTPPQGMIRGWVRKLRQVPRFELTLKAPKTLTQDALASAGPDRVRAEATEWAETVAEPLAAEGRLGAVLLQLSPGILHHRRSLERLDAALDALAPYSVAVEFRNRTWLEEPAPEPRLARDAVQVLDAHDAAPVVVDGPPFPAVEAGDASHAYVRFHGRNEDIWHRGRAAENDPGETRFNRYDYDYSRTELAPWAERVTDLAADKTITRTYFNNHPHGHAVMDAGLFTEMLRAGGAGVEAPRARREIGLERFS